MKCGTQIACVQGPNRDKIHKERPKHAADVLRDSWQWTQYVMNRLWVFYFPLIEGAKLLYQFSLTTASVELFALCAICHHHKLATQISSDTIHIKQRLLDETQA